jgi:hypothetical protein
MQFSDYEREASQYVFYPNETQMSVGLMYNALKMSGEVGEFNDKLGKCISNKCGVIDQDLKDELIKELGDILWHFTRCVNELGTNIDYVAMRNLGKLASRQKRDKLSGSGDNR